MASLAPSPFWRGAGLYGLLLYAATAQAELLRVAFYETPTPPYSFTANSGQLGINREILEAITGETGDTLQIEFYPAARILRQFELGKLDVEAAVNPGWRTSSSVPGLYSLAVDKTRDVLCHHPAMPPPAQSWQSLQGITVGSNRGFLYPTLEPYFRSGQFRREDGKDDKEILTKLGAGRYDWLVINEAVLDYAQKIQHRKLCLPIAIIGEAEVMLRLHPSKAGMLPRINAAILKLHANGRLAAIRKQYQ